MTCGSTSDGRSLQPTPRCPGAEPDLEPWHPTAQRVAVERTRSRQVPRPEIVLLLDRSFVHYPLKMLSRVCSASSERCALEILLRHFSSIRLDPHYAPAVYRIPLFNGVEELFVEVQRG